MWKTVICFSGNDNSVDLVSKNHPYVEEPVDGFLQVIAPGEWIRVYRALDVFFISSDFVVA